MPDLDNPDNVVGMYKRIRQYVFTFEDFGTFVHTAADNMLVFKQISHEKVPKFNAPIFSANKQKIAIIDEIFGPINEVVISLLLTSLNFSIVPPNLLQEFKGVPSRQEISVSSPQNACFMLKCSMNQNRPLEGEEGVAVEADLGEDLGEDLEADLEEEEVPLGVEAGSEVGQGEEVQEVVVLEEVLEEEDNKLAFDIPAKRSFTYNQCVGKV